MNDLLNFNNDLFKSFGIDDLDINKLLVIILLLTGKLDIEAVHVYRYNFIVSLATFTTEQI